MQFKAILPNILSELITVTDSSSFNIIEALSERKMPSPFIEKGGSLVI